MTARTVGTGVLAVALLAIHAPAATIVRSGTASDATGLAGIVNLFRADLGDPNNGVTPGSQAAGRREITWDGGGAAANAAVFTSPMTAFSNRGNVYTTPGTGFEISGQPSPEFGDINATYPQIFQVFSSPRLFSALGSNVLDVHFTQPGSTTIPALTRGFGAVFTDVDLPTVSALEFFGPEGQTLDKYFAEPADNGLSFLGVVYDQPMVSRVRITAGTAALGPNDGPGADVVALDDFIYAEPQAVPEPATLWSIFGGLALLLGRRLTERRR